MRRLVAVFGLCTVMAGCNPNENKEARIRRLESEADEHAAKIRQLEERLSQLEENSASQ